MGDRDHDGEETFVRQPRRPTMDPDMLARARRLRPNDTLHPAHMGHGTPSQRGPEGYDPEIRCTRTCTPTVIVPTTLHCISIMAPYRYSYVGLSSRTCIYAAFQGRPAQGTYRLETGRGNLSGNVARSMLLMVSTLQMISMD